MELVVIALIAVLVLVSGYRQDVLFPSNDEYDLFEFLPPTNTMGFPPLWSSAPYGGYSRACSSRLSKLPLRLIGDGAQFEEQESQDQQTFFSIRDGQGRLFSCKAYTQEDLHDISVHDSLFNDALLLKPEQGEEEDSTHAASHTRSQDHPYQQRQASASQDNNIINHSFHQNQRDPYFTVGNKIGGGESVFGLVDRELQGACAQFHAGYWSYEWCYKDTFRQFHVASNKADRSGFFIYTVDTVILLGKYRSEALKSTNVLLNHHEQDSTATTTTTIPSSIKDYTILHTYKGGTVCETTGKPRKAKVTLKCCSEQQTKILLEQQQQQQRPHQLFSTSPAPSDKVLLIKVEEDKNNLCTYEAEVCTPLLCPNVYGNSNYFYDPTNSNNELFQRTPWLRSQHQHQQPSTTTTTTSIRGSIRLILQNALEGLCLQRQDGWWRYEICHMKHTRQFHIGTAVDSKTGVAVAKVETDHLLGLYLDEAITKGKSSMIVDNASYGKKEGDDDEEGEIDDMEHKETSDAAYVVEYANGDLCDNSPEDVRDQALTQVARSTTVKYSCGKNYDLSKVEEDRTCHYVFHVTIPDLCRHPWFHVPVRKEQIIKCLPVPSDFL